MNPRVTQTVVSGLAAGIGSFGMLVLLDNSVPSAILFAIITALVAAGVAWFQSRPRA